MKKVGKRIKVIIMPNPIYACESNKPFSGEYSKLIEEESYNSFQPKEREYYHALLENGRYKLVEKI